MLPLLLLAALLLATLFFGLALALPVLRLGTLGLLPFHLDLGFALAQDLHLRQTLALDLNPRLALLDADLRLGLLNPHLGLSLLDLDLRVRLLHVDLWRRLFYLHPDFGSWLLHAHFRLRLLDANLGRGLLDLDLRPLAIARLPLLQCALLSLFAATINACALLAGFIAEQLWVLTRFLSLCLGLLRVLLHVFFLHGLGLLEVLLSDVQLEFAFSLFLERLRGHGKLTGLTGRLDQKEVYPGFFMIEKHVGDLSDLLVLLILQFILHQLAGERNLSAALLALSGAARLNLLLMLLIVFAKRLVNLLSLLLKVGNVLLRDRLHALPLLLIDAGRDLLALDLDCFGRNGLPFTGLGLRTALLRNENEGEFAAFKLQGEVVDLPKLLSVLRHHFLAADVASLLHIGAALLTCQLLLLLLLLLLACLGLARRWRWCLQPWLLLARILLLARRRLAGFLLLLARLRRRLLSWRSLLGLAEGKTEAEGHDGSSC